MPRGTPFDRKAPAGGGEPDADLLALGRELQKALGELGSQFKEAFAKVQGEAQYRLDQEFAKALAKHPELYADLRKAMRQLQKAADEAAKAFGIEKR